MSKLLGKIQVESSIPAGSLDIFTFQQLETLTGFSKISQSQCKSDPAIWEWIVSHKFDKTFFSNADVQQIQIRMSELKHLKTVGITNVQETVSSLKGTFEWTLEKTTFQLPGKEPVVRTNTVIPTVYQATRPGSQCLRTFICQFFDIHKGALVVILNRKELDLVYDHPLCPINPAGVRAFQHTLNEVFVGAPSYNQAITRTPTVTGAQFYDLMNTFLESVDLNDYYSLQDLFVTQVIRGFSWVKTGDPVVKYSLKTPKGKDKAVMIMTKAAASALKVLPFYNNYVKYAGREPIAFIGPMDSFVQLPDQVQTDVFYPLIQAVDLVLGSKRGLGPIIKSANYLPLQSSVLREANFLLMGYKLARKVGIEKIDIVMTSSSIYGLLCPNIPIEDVKTDVVNFVSLAKQSKITVGERAFKPLRPDTFVIQDLTMAVAGPKAKADSSAHYRHLADEHLEVFPKDGFFLATVFHPAFITRYHLVTMKYALKAHGILCSNKELVDSIVPEHDLKLVPTWTAWIKKCLLDPKRFLLACVCPDVFGSSVGYHVKFDNILTMMEPGSITDYKFVNREDTDWNDEYEHDVGEEEDIEPEEGNIQDEEEGEESEKTEESDEPPAILPPPQARKKVKEDPPKTMTKAKVSSTKGQRRGKARVQQQQQHYPSEEEEEELSVEVTEEEEDEEDEERLTSSRHRSKAKKRGDTAQESDKKNVERWLAASRM